MDTPRPSALPPEWYEAIRCRTSRRRYTGEGVPSFATPRLSILAENFRPYPDVRVALVRNEPENIFMGWVGSYGRIEGAPSAALLIGPRGSGEGVGYTGEGLVLEATRFGVGTCWVAGNFSRSKAAAAVHLEEHEHVICATPLGIATDEPAGDERLMRGAVRAARRKPLSRIAPGAEEGAWPEWALAAAEAVRLAPSGSNRQPWHLHMEDGTLVIRCPGTAYPTANVDRGIAMLHAELGAASRGVTGVWERLPSHGTVRFVPRTA